MKFIIINKDLGKFSKWLYTKNPGLEQQSYEQQHQVRMDTLFGLADFYSTNLQKLGYEAWDVIANNEPMQKRWAGEHGLKYDHVEWKIRLRKGIVPWPYRAKEDWLYPILAEQIKFYKPDIIYSLNMGIVDSQFLRSVQGYFHLAVGQHAATPLYSDIRDYHLVLSSLPSQVDFFQNSNLKSELFRLGFEPRILERIKDRPKQYPLTFVGGFEGIYKNGISTLEHLVKKVPLSIWGFGVENLSPFSPLRWRSKGPLWGIDMYQVFHESKIVFNRHSDLADLYYANNMRLYEATGVGTMLLTDYKQNLHEMFELGKEVVVYHNSDECAELAKYYLEHDSEREAIARAGQLRTLRDHNYYLRMQEMVEIIRRYL